MRRKKKGAKSTITAEIRCQCQDRAVPKEGSLLWKVRCKECGKIFKSNIQKDHCFSCKNKNKW